ncbi:DUF6894 family protein [Methylobacterium nigriterrae]|uniref:DUF6894 family protein n=1 Tax=Methylobacterium nigriterrae TaxID=3127512 RepID=UPI0030139AF7
MPRYYLDLHSGSQHVKDAAKFDAKADDDARVQAFKTLASILQNLNHSSGQVRYVASVRNRRGINPFHIDLSLDFTPPN